MKTSRLLVKFTTRPSPRSHSLASSMPFAIYNSLSESLRTQHCLFIWMYDCLPSETINSEGVMGAVGHNSDTGFGTLKDIRDRVGQGFSSSVRSRPRRTGTPRPSLLLHGRGSITMPLSTSRVPAPTLESASFDDVKKCLPRFCLARGHVPSLMGT